MEWQMMRRGSDVRRRADAAVMALVLVGAGAAWAACGSSGTAHQPDGQGGSDVQIGAGTKLVGVFTGPTRWGRLDLTVGASTNNQAAPSELSVHGTITAPGKPRLVLDGTVNPTLGTLAVSGAAYWFKGTLAENTVTGNYHAPDDGTGTTTRGGVQVGVGSCDPNSVTGLFTLVASADAAVYCGYGQETVNGAPAAGLAAPTSVIVDGSRAIGSSCPTNPCTQLSGAVDGSSLSLTGSSSSGAMTTLTGLLSGSGATGDLSHSAAGDPSRTDATYSWHASTDCSQPGPGDGGIQPCPSGDGCVDNTDCGVSQACVAEGSGQRSCKGIMLTSMDCASDADCSTNQTCVDDGTGATVCANIVGGPSACSTTSDCPAGQACGDDGLCAVYACTAQADCPGDSVCTAADVCH
jgi:hypothetical protein